MFAMVQGSVFHQFCALCHNNDSYHGNTDESDD